MAVWFTVGDDGIIDAHCAPHEGLFDLALNDAVSSRAPRGAAHQGLSTYWIDRAESMLRFALDQGSTEPIASGNATYLRLDGDRIVAGFDFDPEETDAESMPVVEFLALLDEWRRAVTGGVSGPDAALMVDNPSARPMGPAT